MTAPTSARRASSSARSNGLAGGQTLEDLLLADGPDPAGDALAAGLVPEEGGDAQQEADQRSTESSTTMTTPEPSVAPAAAAPSKVRGTSRPSGATKAPAAPPSRTPCSARPGRQAAGQLERSARVTPKGTSYTPGERTDPETANSLVPVERSVPDGGVGGPAPLQDGQDVDQGLDVVDHGGLAEEADLDGERRLVAGLAPVALDGVEDGGLFAADVGARPPGGSRRRRRTRGPSRRRRGSPGRRRRRWPAPACAAPGGTRPAGRRSPVRSRWPSRRWSWPRARRRGRPPGGPGP